MLIFKLNKPVKQIVADSGINKNSALFAAGEARKLMHEFVPMDTGALAQNADIFAGDENTGVICYTQPYAGFCYYGDKKIFSRDKHEKATAYWDTAMILSHRGILSGRVKDFIKNRR